MDWGGGKARCRKATKMNVAGYDREVRRRYHCKIDAGMGYGAVQDGC